MSRVATLALLLTACTATHDEAPEVATGAATVPVEPGADGPTPEVIPELAPPEPAADGQAGVAPARFPTPSSWTSPPCGDRGYERQIHFDGDRWSARDLVSPCPPGTLCVWSGIIDRQGSWSLDRKQLRLLPDADAPTAPQAGKFPLPDQLWLGPDGTLTEAEGRCPYTQMQTP